MRSITSDLREAATPPADSTINVKSLRIAYFRLHYGLRAIDMINPRQIPEQPLISELRNATESRPALRPRIAF